MPQGRLATTAGLPFTNYSLPPFREGVLLLWCCSKATFEQALNRLGELMMMRHRWIAY